MGRKLSQGMFDQMEELYAQNYPNAQIAKKVGVSPATTYGYTVAVERGFKSLTDYNNFRMGEKQKLPRNQELATLINERLAELGKTQSWLSLEAGVLRQSVSLYCRGKIFPKPGVLFSVYQALDVNADLLEREYPCLASTYSNLEKIVA